MSAGPHVAVAMAEIAAGGSLVALTGENALATLREAWQRPSSAAAQAVLAVGALQVLAAGVGTGLVMRGVRRLLGRGPAAAGAAPEGRLRVEG